MTTDDFIRTVRGAIRIPAGSRGRLCMDSQDCGQFVYFVPPTKPGGKQRCVSVIKYKDNPGGIPPTETEDGAGIDHHANCPSAARFRR
jgi:hypothetical protein